MLYPIKVADIELSRPLTTLEGLEGYMGVQALLRLHGVPLGYVKAPIYQGCCPASKLSQLILEQHSSSIITELLKRGLAAPKPSEALQLETLLDLPAPEFKGDLPPVTVAVCTRDRAADLALCIEALCQLDYPNLDLLVVDNAPTTTATKDLVEQYSQVRYVCEPRPGLDWARNRAIMEAKGEIVAYTDDDVLVDRGWVRALAQVFAENPEVMAVTGLVVPFELETEAQVLFEIRGGFGRGFQRKWFKNNLGNPLPWGWQGSGQYGTGANMAYRRRVFEEIGNFDPALDVGTVTNGGGDLEMFFRVLKEGNTLVYEPKAIVRHRHRRDYAQLRSQLANNSMGLISYFIRSFLAYPDERLAFMKLWLWWLIVWNLRCLWIGFKHPTEFPQEIILGELKGCFVGLTKYYQARRNAERIASSQGDTIDWQQPAKNSTKLPIPGRGESSAVRTVDIDKPLEPIADIADYPEVAIFVQSQGHTLGSVKIANAYQTVSVSRLVDVIVSGLGLKLLEPSCSLPDNILWAKILSCLNQHYEVEVKENVTTVDSLSFHPSVSIVVATFDRPDDLRNCLQFLSNQDYPGELEIVVVDNHPTSHLTPPVVAEFPKVVLVNESRQGLAYARNAGIVASQGDLIVATDDDVTVPPDWLTNLVAPFARPDVMVVTGNVLPIQLETRSQQLFEMYGGLGRGFEKREVSSQWFESFPRLPVPTWTLGATANAAFRATMFDHPQIGLMPEVLGPGMPSGVGEDTYLFYRALKAGYTIVYEPKAYVWHKHRRELESLRRQIYNYSKGHVAYHLYVWLNDRDWRGWVQILAALPVSYYHRLKGILWGGSDYSGRLLLLEIAGNLAGPWSLWKSYQRLSREGASTAYVPVSKRSPQPNDVCQVLERGLLPTATNEPVLLASSDRLRESES